MSHVYILLCSDGTYYTGAATDIKKRMIRHHNGKGAKYTRGRLPVQIVYCEYCDTFSEALKKEKKIQKMTRSKKKEIILNSCE